MLHGVPATSKVPLELLNPLKNQIDRFALRLLGSFLCPSLRTRACTRGRHSDSAPCAGTV